MVQGVRFWPSSGLWEAIIPRSQAPPSNESEKQEQKTEEVADVATFSSVGRAFAELGDDIDFGADD